VSQHQELEREVRVIHRTFLRQIDEYTTRLKEWDIDPSLLDPIRVLCRDVIEYPHEMVELILDLPSSQSYYS